MISDLSSRRPRRHRSRLAAATPDCRLGRAWTLCAAAAVALAAARLDAAESLATLTVKAGKHERVNTPVCVELTGSADLPKEVRLVEVAKGEARTAACQIEAGAPPRLWFVLAGKTPAGKQRVFSLEAGAAKGDVATVSVRKTDAALVPVCAGAPVFQYNVQPLPGPKGVNKIYERTAYVHPLWSSNAKGKQRVLTDDFPRDHYHHHGIWFPWTHTVFEGRHVDFWNLGKRQGTVRFVKLLATTEGRVWGGFRTEHEFVVFERGQARKDERGRARPAEKAGEKVALKEIWDVRVFNVGRDQRLFQVTSTQWCATDSPLELPKYRYGGFSCRAAGPWRCDKNAYLTDAGKDGTNCDNTKARWCVMTGEIDGQRDSITMMSHPSNQHHPEPLRTWVGRNKHLFCNFASMRHEGWTMKPGQKYVFRYRVHVAEGRTSAETASRLWNDFADPPAVTISK